MDYFGARVRREKLSQVSAAYFIMHMVDNPAVHLKLESNRTQARPDSLRMWYTGMSPPNYVLNSRRIVRTSSY